MANEQNLKPFNTLCREDAKKLSSKGGIARAKSIKRKKTFAELARAMMDCKPTKEQLQVLKEIFPDLDIKDITNRSLMIQAQMQKAVEGDTKAFEVLRDTIGEAPVKKSEHEHNGKIELPVINVNYTKEAPKVIEGEIVEEN